jgi:hypothetical protein
MAFKEESLEDKIAAIMAGNYSFGPPIKLPVPKSAVVPAGPVAAPSAINMGGSTSSPAPPLGSPSPVSNATSIKSVTDGGNDEGSSRERATAIPSVPANPAQIAVTGALPSLNATQQPERSPLPSTSSAYVGFGDVYEDSTAKVQYNEEDLHADAVSEGFEGLGHNQSVSTVKFGDVYAEPEVGSFDRTGGKGASTADDEDSVTSPPPEEVEVDTTGDAGLTAALAPAETAGTKPAPAPVAERTLPPAEGLPQRSPLSVPVGESESDSGKVQPQLDFIPLSARSSSRETMALEGNGLALNTDEAAALGSRQSAYRASWESPRESPLAVPTLKTQAPVPAAGAPSGVSVQRPASRNDDEAAADTVEEALEEPAQSSDAVQSLLFGEGPNLDESGDFGHPDIAGEAVPALDMDAAEGELHMDDDSLNGADESSEHGHSSALGVNEDLMQTVRVTRPAPAAVREAPAQSVPAIKPPTATPPAVERKVPAAEVSPSTVSASPAKPTTKAAAGADTANQSTGVAPDEASSAVLAPLQEPTGAAAAPSKPRVLTPSALAREKAAFLLPTIVEEKPPTSAPKPAPKPAAAPTGLPVKVPAHTPDTNPKGQAHFLARISAATSVPIEKPPASEHASAPSSVPKPSPAARERSTTPTSIPKPASTATSRPTTPPSTSRPSSAGSTHSVARNASASASAAAGDTEKSSKPAKSGVLARISAIERAESVKQVSSPPAPAPAPAKRSTSTKKTPAVLMSATSADEIALASSGATSSKPAGGTSKKSATKSLSASRAALAAVAHDGVAEATLLSSPEPPQQRPLVPQEEQKEPATTPGSSRKSKAAAWVIGPGGKVERVAPPPSGTAPPATAALPATPTGPESPAEPAGPVPMSLPSAKKASKAAAWVIENAPTEGKSSPVKTPSKVRLQEAPHKSASASHTTAHTSTVPVNASASAALLFGHAHEYPHAHTPTTPERDARARAVSPNTTARSVSRVSHNHALQPPATSVSGHGAEDNAHPERAVKVAVRVRPLTAAELHQGHKRTLSMNAGRMVVVNPKSYEDDPDPVAAVAISTENRQWAHLFQFDNVLWDYDAQTKRQTLVDQVELHRHLGLDIVENALQGVSSSCFAYGHTCTGKTYSLFGAEMIDPEHAAVRGGGKVPISLARFSLGPESGLIQRVFHDVIHLSHKSTRMFVTFMEIYNEKIRDLLVDQPSRSESRGTSDTRSHHSNGSTSGRIHPPTHIAPAADGLKLREHPTFGPYVENLVKVEVFSVDDALRLVAKGQAARSSAQTIWNANSSRSHAVVTLELSPTEIDPSKQFTDPRAREYYERSHSPHMSPVKAIHNWEGEASPGSLALRDYEAPLLEQVVRIQMVDLAGSEKDSMRDEDDHGVWAGARFDATPNKSQESLAEKERNELRLIRRSLSTLGYIIKALTKGASMRSLPYRDCTLTFLLKDALCGRNHTTMLATVSPSHTCYEETLSTLRYAERLCEVHNTRRLGIPSADGSGPSMASRLIPSTVPRKVVLDEFRRVHQGLVRDSARHSEKSRDFIRRMLADVTPKQPRFAQSDLHHDATDVNGVGHSAEVDISKIPALSKPLAEVTEEERDQLKQSYQHLASLVAELQLNLDTARSDRDTLTSELRAATDLLNDYESAKTDSKAQVASLAKYLRAAEKELTDLQALLRRRDAEVDRLAAELGEEKQARSQAEQTHQARTKDFLARLDTLKK